MRAIPGPSAAADEGPGAPVQSSAERGVSNQPDSEHLGVSFVQMALMTSIARKLGFRGLLGVGVFLFFPAAAHADAGIPMLPFAYPVILLFFFR